MKRLKLFYWRHIAPKPWKYYGTDKYFEYLVEWCAKGEQDRVIETLGHIEEQR